MFYLKKSNPGYPLLLQEEPIYLENKIIGRSTSGNYSFNYKKNISFGYIDSEISDEQLVNKNLYIEVEKEKYALNILTEPLKSKKIRFS